MAAPVKSNPSGREPTSVVKPYIPASESPAELTWSAVLLGTILGIVFGTSSLYLVLKVGMTVSASIPVAVMSITLFRWLSRMFGMRPATILENNIVQTTGSAGESIAFGIGVTLPALMLLGFDMEATQVMTVGVLGGLLGILMMIPLRKAFIVKQHDVLPYPEGTACAEVLIAGEKGGSTAKTVFFGFGLAFFYNILMKVGGFWKETVIWPLKYITTNETINQATNETIKTTVTHELPAGQISGELTPELLGVGYIIGPKIAGITFAGGLMAYLILLPMIKMFGSDVNKSIFPAPPEARMETVNGQLVDTSLIRNMTPKNLRDDYVLYIGAGAVATGGILSMFQAMPMILGSLVSAFRDLRAGKSDDPAVKSTKTIPRTERDMPLWIVLAGSIGMLVALMAVPQLGLGFSEQGAIGAAMVLCFGFLFVTVSARLTGAIGSSSNPISGMTISTLLLTCLIFYFLDKTAKPDTMVALVIAAVVCVASSNGGTTAQDLKTGHLVGATPRSQQYAILIGALTSALVMGWTLIYLNQIGTIYTTNAAYLPRATFRLPAGELKELKLEKPGGEYGDEKYEKHDKNEYYAFHATASTSKTYPEIKEGKYLVDKDGVFRYYIDPPINGRIGISVTTSKTYQPIREQDRNEKPLNLEVVRQAPKEERDGATFYLVNIDENAVPKIAAGQYLVDEQGFVRHTVKVNSETLRLRDSDVSADGKSTGNGITPYDAPKTRLMQIIIDGVLNQKLPWTLVIIGALIAVMLELAGIPALPFAVGIYLPLSVSTPIFIGGMVRWLVERRTKTTDAESDSSPGVLLSSGYIAGGAIAGVLATFFDALATKSQKSLVSIQGYFPMSLKDGWDYFANEIPLIPFGILVLILLMVGMGWLFSGKVRVKEKAPTPPAPKTNQPATPPKPVAPLPKPNDLERRK
jgi:putative OPT family oligopeptide transporter